MEERRCTSPLIRSSAHPFPQYGTMSTTGFTCRYDSMIFDTGRDVLQRVPMREPLRGTRQHVEDLLEANPEAAGLVESLQG